MALFPPLIRGLSGDNSNILLGRHFSEPVVVTSQDGRFVKSTDQDLDPSPSLVFNV